MPRKRDPKRDQAFEIWKDSNGQINPVEIARQLGISDGTVRGWKAKDEWDKRLVCIAEEAERSDGNTERDDLENAGEYREQDELFVDAVRIVVELQQASTSLLQRRMRIGYTRSARLIDEMEKRGYVGPYQGDKPREVLIKEFDHVRNTERNVPKKEAERSENMERSKLNTEREKPSPKPEREIDLTEKRRLFVLEYLRDFNATRAAIAVGYSKKTAYSIGWEILRKPEIQEEIQRYKEIVTGELGLEVQRVIAELMKIAFADISDVMEFGLHDIPLRDDEGKVLLNENGEPITEKFNYVALKNADEIDSTVISEVKKTREGVSVKLHDKMRALEKLERYLPYMTEEEKLKLDKMRADIKATEMKVF
ncbi:terminase small subunit [Paenibacillus oleatilyticus]|uniref:terminase small subunit n=1 Tax=Paenibacillus oleatilyticus TaxID=2594886 RepID=UPI001C1F73EB|nr:terminase small subunit [Paenibacillus oleatilyticus]MBU7320289.1 terminase small subunit [Paenibacillus oleatilyticus]